MVDGAKNENVVECPGCIIEKRIQMYSDMEIEEYATKFKSMRFVSIPNFLGPEMLDAIRNECEYITEYHGKNKNLLIKSTGDTPQQMRTVGQHILSRKSTFIPKIYSSGELCNFISRLAGEEVFRAPWAPEEYVLSNLYRNGDTHGWHIVKPYYARICCSPTPQNASFFY
ncbi:HalD/BesD family halogenase [Vreelandella olivaria]|uniref:HalD/BesD family halogenase n=1 Tax=Vreelandella olivaria TaxID=390919 RepID=UPI00201E9110|nr:hypothetical protein [Halomonas olivaria]